jgi:ComF family protein
MTARSMLSRLRHWPQHAFALLAAAIPSSCALCGSSGRAALCNGCQAQFFARRRHRCARCAIPIAGDMQTCGACLKQGPAFDATVVAADYAPPVDQLVLALKFGGRLELASLFASILQEAWSASARSQSSMLLTAVPLGSRRLADRGFNQALEIARPLARSLGIQMNARITIRQRDTDAQAQLHPDARHKNIRGAFAVPDHAVKFVRDRHVGVVDDVMTTGETLDELAAVLKRAGAASVTNLVFARTPEK